MFDIGFSELMILAIVALVVVGPERLPKVARTLGHLLGRFQRYVSDVKSDIDRELRLDEMKKLREEVETQARSIGTQVSSEMQEVQGDLAKPAEDIAKLMQNSAPSLSSLETQAAVPAADGAAKKDSGPATEASAATPPESSKPA